jgi:4-hydroxy-tetrahydrodipicolinate reductase
MTTIAINGAAGRMGRRVAALAIEGGQFDVAAALEAAGHEAIGRDVGELAGVGTFGLAVAEAWGEPPQVVVDFSTPEGTLSLLAACRAGGVPMVTGTTGLTESQQAEIADAAAGIPIVKAANFSVGINVLLGLVAQAAKALGDGYDVEIAEAHHRFKKDAPSGTAIALARAICEATGREYGESAALGRGGRQPRKPGEIGMHALRLGDTVGEHAVHFGALGETVTLSHSAHTRETFARGALRAAGWIVGRPPGLYDMRDVLDLRAGG